MFATTTDSVFHRFSVVFRPFLPFFDRRKSRLSKFSGKNYIIFTVIREIIDFDLILTIIDKLLRNYKALFTQSTLPNFRHVHSLGGQQVNKDKQTISTF
jgi:hypothetical protein